MKVIEKIWEGWKAEEEIGRGSYGTVYKCYKEENTIEGATLKTLCEKQGCWDSKNSSSIFEREIKLFIKKKVSTKKWTIALTIDGEQAATELMEGMINDKK